MLFLQNTYYIQNIFNIQTDYFYQVISNMFSFLHKIDIIINNFFLSFQKDLFL